MRVLKALLIFLFSFSFNIFAAPVSEVGDNLQKGKPCELLMAETVKNSVDLEMNYRLQSLIRTEVFVQSIQSKGEGLGHKVSATFDLNTYLQNIEKIQKTFAEVVKKSIEGFDRYGYQSKGYAEKGLSDEDGVIYEVFHPDNTSSYIVLSRGGDSLDGFDPDVFADGDLKVGRQQGQMEDLSAISIEVLTEIEYGMLKGQRFVTMPNKSGNIYSSNFVSTKEQWLKYLGDRLNQAVERGMRKASENSYGHVYVKD